MELLKTEAFTFEERQYEIHLYGNAWDFTVHVYLDGKPANGYSYSVSLPTAMDLRIARDLDAVRVLIDDAKRDIENKAWEKYVEAYIANLKKVPSGTIGCRRCGGRKISATTVDQREMYECEDCANIWYAPRQSTSGPLVIIDEITEGVEKNGSHKIATSILLNGVFRSDGQKGVSFQDQLKNWARQNKLQYETGSSGAMQYLRFWR